MELGDDNLVVNGDCQYDISFYDIDCNDPSSRIGALSYTTIGFVQATFTMDGDGLSTISAENDYYLNIPDLKASSDLTLPDNSQICIEYEVAPNNSIYYTDSIIIKEIFTFYHCNPVFPGPDASITESYGLGGTALEIEIESLETSRCAKTKFEYEFYQDDSLVSDATDFVTITESPTTRSATLSFYSNDIAKEGTW